MQNLHELISISVGADGLREHLATPDFQIGLASRSCLLTICHWTGSSAQVRGQLLPASPRVPPRARVRAEAPRPANFSFGVIADVQWADVPDGTANPRNP